MTPRLNLFLVVLLLVVGGPYYWFLVDNRSGPVASQPVTIAQLRRLSSGVDGKLPVRIDVERVAYVRRRSNWVAAGTGARLRVLSVMAFRVDFTGEPPVVIDTGLSRHGSRKRSVTEYDPEAQAAIEAAMATARAIILTGARIDQTDGLIHAGSGDVLARAVISPQQSKTLGSKAPPPRLAGDAVEAVAPGVVVIPAEGPTAGVQMVYVRLVNGREYLFTGDLAPISESWQLQRGRPRIRTDYLLPEDRAAAKSWLRTIARLKREAPALFVIPGRDYDVIKDKKAGHRISPTFSDRDLR